MLEIPYLDDDGLMTPEIGPWGIEKYKLLALYSSVFLRSMRNKWESLIYIDLFSGAGRARIKGTSRIVPASPIIVLGLEAKFDKYIFCEIDKEKCYALTKRVDCYYRECKIEIVNCDVNIDTEKILGMIPQPYMGNRVLSFCFVDPYKLGNLNFATIRKLSDRYMDFLILIPSGMDARRHMGRYVKAVGNKLDTFLGRSNWIDSFKKAVVQGRLSFESFVVQEFSKSMESLRFIDPGLENTKIIFAYRNLLLYRLVLYSRNKLGGKFWNEIRKSLEPQRKLIFPE